jgi:hypothetical protein
MLAPGEIINHPTSAIDRRIWAGDTRVDVISYSIRGASMRSLCAPVWVKWPAVRRNSLLKRPKIRVLFALLVFALVGGQAHAENCISLYPANSLDRKACLCRQFLSTPSGSGCKRSCGPSTGYRPKQFHCGPLTQGPSRSPVQSAESRSHLATPGPESRPPWKSSDKRTSSRGVSNSEPIGRSTGASAGGSDSVRAQAPTQPADSSVVNAAPKMSTASKPAQRLGNPQPSHPRADTTNAQGHSCFNVDPQTGQRCIPPPGSPIVDMNTTLSDGTLVTRFNWKLTNGCSRNIQVMVRQDNGVTPVLVSGKSSRTSYCLSSEGCHKFMGYSEKCGK